MNLPRIYPDPDPGSTKKPIYVRKISFNKKKATEDLDIRPVPDTHHNCESGRIQNERKLGSRSDFVHKVKS